MFRPFNNILLELDLCYHQGSNGIVISDRWEGIGSIVGDLEVLLREDRLVATPSLYELWERNGVVSGPTTYFVSPNQLIDFQIVFWKVLFGDALDAMTGYFLHQTEIESERLYAYTTPEKGSRLLEDLVPLSLEDFVSKFHDLSVEKSSFLDPATLPFEYLLPSYLLGPSQSVKEALLEKVAVITWENWLDEIRQLRYEAIIGAIDGDRLDGTMSPNVGSLERDLQQSEKCGWLVDPQVGWSRDYLEQHYHLPDFSVFWQDLYTVLNGEADDMLELGELIHTGKFETLLQRDIERGYGCTYTSKQYAAASNFVFSSWLYRQYREGNLGALTPFKL